MAKRKIIKIDEDKCNGCGNCIPNCPEGALQIIDGKARLISDLFCDGLGACIGKCPLGAIKIEERQAEDYDERKVMENIIKQGENTIKAHLKHLKEHNQAEFLREAIEVLREKGIEVPQELSLPDEKVSSQTQREVNHLEKKSYLEQWPIQLGLISPEATFFNKADVLLVADCAAYAVENFASQYLKGKRIVIACPKLDNRKEVYKEKLKSLVEQAKINTLSVIFMEVPCCRGLLELAQEALGEVSRYIPLKSIIVSIKGEVLSQEWI